MPTPIEFLSVSGSRLADGTPNAGGRVRFVRPDDEQTEVNVWQDEDGAAAWPQPLVLDDGGILVGTVFVDQDVMIQISDSDDQLLQSFRYAGGVSSKAVEIIHPSFSGEVDGATTAGERTVLYDVLSSLAASTGGKDGKFADSAGGTERTLVTVINEFGLSVKSRGAVGNGSTIDTAAFKSVISTLKARGGGRMIVPPGTYLLNDDLFVDFAGLEVVCMGNPTIKQMVTNEKIFNVDLTGAATDRFTIRGGNYTCAGASSETAIYIKDVRFLRVEDLIISDGNFSVGLALNTCQYGQVSGGLYYGTVTGLLLDTTNFVSVYDVYGQSTAGSAAQISAGGDNRIFGGYFATTAGFGLVLTNTDRNGLIGCVFAGNSTISTNTCDDNWEIGCTMASGAFVDGGTRSVLLSLSKTRPVGGKKGADITAAATIAANDANFFLVAGNTNISNITTNHVAGQVVTFRFSGTPTVNNAAGGAGQVRLSGSANFAATANDTLTLVYDGTDWHEVARTVI